jgi:hypothetical protein
MTKPRLPLEIQALLPHCIVKHIHSFVPPLPPIQPMIAGLQREIEKLQRGTKQNTMYLYGLIE